MKAIGVDQNATYRVCAGFVDANFNITGDSTFTQSIGEVSDVTSRYH
jgi:hypothetical protein